MKKIKWGVMGTADIGVRSTIPGMLLAETCELYAIAGRNPEKVKAFQEKYGFTKGYNSYMELLEDPEVEVIYNPLPNSLHHDWTIEALKHKKHVLCEKPFAPTPKEAEEMFAVAKENGVCVMEAFAYLQSPYIRAVKEELEKGSIGEVRYMRTAFMTSDYDISNIRMRKETYGGAMYDIGVYTSSLIMTMLGLEPTKVQAMASFDENGIDKLTTVMMEYDGDKRAVMTTGMVLATEKNDSVDCFEIHGSEGRLVSESFLFNGSGALSYVIERFDGTKIRKVMDIPHNYMLEVEQFGRVIREGEAPVVSEAFTLANARLVDTVLKQIGY